MNSRRFRELRSRHFVKSSRTNAVGLPAAKRHRLEKQNFNHLLFHPSKDAFLPARECPLHPKARGAQRTGGCGLDGTVTGNRFFMGRRHSVAELRRPSRKAIPKDARGICFAEPCQARMERRMLCTRILRQQASQGKKNAVAVQHMCGTANFRWMGHSLAGSFAVRHEE